MFRMLHAMFPWNRHQSMTGAHSRATPFSVYQDKSSTVPVLGKPKKVTKCDKPVCDNECILDDAFDRLQDSIDHLTVMTECKERNGRYCPGRSSSRPLQAKPSLQAHDHEVSMEPLQSIKPSLP